MRRLVPLLALLTLCACSLTHKKANNLSRVAKDWCLTIRASQVLPVYPLTEDLQVGDVFLVSTPLEEETQILESHGFLPLDNLLARVQPSGYAAFYNGAYGVTADGKVPQQWQFPASPRTAPPATEWGLAPGAAFPSYTFQIKEGQGASLALPIHAVPVGLSLLSTSSAYGSVNISNAATYAIPIVALSPQIDEWAARNRPFLAQFRPRRTTKSVEYNYLRTVYRVYVAGGVTVSLIDDSTRGGRLDAGQSKPVTLFDAGNANNAVNAAANMESILKSLNASVASITPGANVTVSAASSRAVAMSETFPRPLAIGYLAFDRSIEDGGFLGPPIPTHARLTGKPVQFAADGSADKINHWLRADAANAPKLQTWLSENGFDPANLAAYIWGAQYAALRQRIVTQFQLQ